MRDLGDDAVRGGGDDNDDDDDDAGGDDVDTGSDDDDADAEVDDVTCDIGVSFLRNPLKMVGFVRDNSASLLQTT